MRAQMRALLAVFVLTLTGWGCSHKATVEVYIRTEGGDTVRLSGARVEVAERVSPPPSTTGRGIRIFKAVKGFKGIVTDSDGKAVLKGLRSKYFVVVFAERRIFGSEETYLWVVAASEARDGKLLLSQHNLSAETFQKLVVLTPYVINAKDNEGMTALLYAIAAPDRDMVELLLANGADVNAKYVNRKYQTVETPLHRAAVFGSKDVTELLLAHGADVNAKDTLRGETPLLMLASERPKAVAVAEVLIAKGADMNVRDEYGNTPLHRAAMARSDSKDLVELLLANGADVNAKDRRGQTPLYGAVGMFGNKETAKVLIAKGANVNARNATGETPLHTAVGCDSYETIDLLLTNGADVNAKDTKGRTALHFAANVGKKAIVEVLIAKGADVNARDTNGSSPLSWASNSKYYGCAAVAELLRTHGATE